ncbi:MAG: alginate lyase family protein [Bacteroidetes bacterium]|nr:alginate lyase family protein [Bacteroidota bacterium]
MKRFISVILVLLTAIFMMPLTTSAQKFVHPGVDQTSQDLAYMKSQVLAGKQPWKDAFDRLKTATDLDFVVKSFPHVLRGPYGKPNIGGDELSKGSNMAYNCALMWYITQNKAYANKAIEILNAWSPVLKDFDYNDAKLLAGWTGHILCNAAEILRYTPSGWQQKDIDSFTNMLMTVYYPLMRYYFPQANGNWDGAIIHSILAIAIFTDNREMFNNAIDHFLHGPVNGSIFKYVYPSGQCQETPRDQGHVQLGLGEFAGAAKVAYTQGVDLFSIGNNRIALGFEYTAQFLLGEKPYCFNVISERAKNLRDDYEYVYRHYQYKGLELPYVKRAADSVRPQASRSVLTAFRAPIFNYSPKSTKLQPGKTAFPSGAEMTMAKNYPANAIIVAPGQSLQKAIDSVAGTNRWVVALAGIHTLPTTLKIPSGVTLAGEGRSTILFLSPSSGVRDAIVNAEQDMHDVTIQNLVVEGASSTDPGSDPNSTRSYRSGGNRGGIMFVANNDHSMANLNFIHLTVRNCTYNGVYINGAKFITVDNCDFTESGSSVVPGPRLQHNLLICHSEDITIKDSRLDTSPYGSGIALDHCGKALISDCEIARNAYYGVLLSECHFITVKGNLIEGNDRSGVMIEYLSHGSDNITVNNNTIHFNNGYGLETYSVQNMKSLNNTYAGNGNNQPQQKISDAKFIIME